MVIMPNKNSSLTTSDCTRCFMDLHTGSAAYMLRIFFFISIFFPHLLKYFYIKWCLPTCWDFFSFFWFPYFSHTYWNHELSIPSARFFKDCVQAAWGTVNRLSPSLAEWDYVEAFDLLSKYLTGNVKLFERGKSSQETLMYAEISGIL